MVFVVIVIIFINYYTYIILELNHSHAVRRENQKRAAYKRL